MMRKEIPTLNGKVMPEDEENPGLDDEEPLEEELPEGLTVIEEEPLTDIITPEEESEEETTQQEVVVVPSAPRRRGRKPKDQKELVKSRESTLSTRPHMKADAEFEVLNEEKSSGRYAVTLGVIGKKRFDRDDIEKVLAKNSSAMKQFKNDKIKAANHYLRELLRQKAIKIV
jgi:hypothetical protein